MPCGGHAWDGEVALATGMATTDASVACMHHVPMLYHGVHAKWLTGACSLMCASAKWEGQFIAGVVMGSGCSTGGDEEADGVLPSIMLGATACDWTCGVVR